MLWQDLGGATILHVHLDSSIGGGKSTSMHLVADALLVLGVSGFTICDEPLHVWESRKLLTAMYTGVGPEALALPSFQHVTLITRAAALSACLGYPGVKLILAERGIESDRHTFALLTHPSLGGPAPTAEARAYAVTYEAVGQMLPLDGVLDINILLSVRPDVAMSRIVGRDRKAEGKVTVDFSRSLIDKYDSYYAGLLDRSPEDT